jgi:4-hydroxy-3-methylbut-2-en-1-yl diphosphate reductase
MTDATYFRRGFGLKTEIAGVRSADYHSRLIEALRAGGHRIEAGRLRFRLAKEFGFCYGVDRAVDYAYETRMKFPDRRLFLVGEIIHNPHVNAKLGAMGIEFLRRPDGGEFDFGRVTADDVVILPAFGVTIHDFARLRALGCVMVDTTCGSVLNVWKRVESYAKDGFTAIIHGKHRHEETKATASQVMKYPGGRYLVVLDMAEARLVTGWIERGADPAPLAARFPEGEARSPGFDFVKDLERVGLANQTTMLSSESLAIAEEFRRAMVAKYGEADSGAHVRSFDTICSATQERQDAVRELLEEAPDVMLVVGGYNSSNTAHLAELAESRGVRTYHIEDSDCVLPGGGALRYRPIGATGEAVATGWLEGVRHIGITAGASTPNNKIGETIARICEAAGVADELAAAIDAVQG